MIDKPIIGEDIYMNPQFADGLVGCWLFNDKPAVTGLTYDISGYNNHGTLVGDTYSVPGLYGNALAFPGTEDYVSVSDSLSLDITGAITLAVCFATTVIYDTSLSDWKRLLDKNDDYTLQFIKNGQVGAGALRLYISNATPQETIRTTTATWNAGIWHCVIFTYDGSTAKAYVNGVEENSNAASGVIGTNNDPLTIGTTDVATQSFNGQIDHIIIYNQALSAGEVALFYQDPFWGFRKNEVGIYAL